MMPTAYFFTQGILCYDLQWMKWMIFVCLCGLSVHFILFAWIFSNMNSTSARISSFNFVCECFICAFIFVLSDSSIFGCTSINSGVCSTNFSEWILKLSNCHERCIWDLFYTYRFILRNSWYQIAVSTLNEHTVS